MAEGLLERTVAPRGAELLWADLAAHAAHDLNNHLTSVLGKSEIALMSPDPARWQRGLEEVLEAGQQARSLVADLQRLARWQLGAEGGVPAPDLLGLVVRLAGRRARRAGVTLEMSGTGSLADSRLAARFALVTWRLVERALLALEAGTDAELPPWRLEATAGPGTDCAITLHHPGGPAVLPGLLEAAEALEGAGEPPADWAAVVELCRDLGATLAPGDHGFHLRMV